MENFLLFRPEYVGKFKCDASKCNNNCCERAWNIFIDADTYKKYSSYPQIIKYIRFDEAKGEYILTRNERGVCPFLTEKKLCGLQLEYGEKFLSATCVTYPRINYYFGKFAEQSLTPTCSLAAEMIFFGREPLKFELVAVSSENLTSYKLQVPEKFIEHLIDIQIAEISILQERTLTINQRLIMLGFFLDKLEEISADTIDKTALRKLLAAYESKNFLAQQLPSMLASVHFDAKKFIGMMLKIFEALYGGIPLGDGQKFFNALIETLELKPDEKKLISAAQVAARYESLAAERKNFSAQYATFLENYLVNELFMNCYPWRFFESITKNYAMFVTTYKVFELFTFAAIHRGLDGRDNSLQLVEWFSEQTNHTYGIRQKIFDQIKNLDDPLMLMNSLLEQ